MAQPRFLTTAVLLSATLSFAMTSVTIAQEEVTEAKAAELIKAADEAKARAERPRPN